MTKQEAVDRILIKYTGRTGNHLDVVKRELAEVGVVIRVERGLPAMDDKFLDLDGGVRDREIDWGDAYEEGRTNLIQNGYVAVEPLLEE